MIVPDASVVIDVLLQRTGSEALLERLLDPAVTLHAPHLLDVEVAQVLRRVEARGDMNPVRGRDALAILGQFPIRRYGHEPLLNRIWELRHNLTAYDAAYVALAEAIGAPLLTRDDKLANAPGHHARIELV